MPEPTLYFKSMAAAAIASALFLLTMRGLRRFAGTPWLNAGCVLGVGVGIVLGCDLLSLHLNWPPANGLDRLLTIVIPSVLCIEFLAGFQSVPRWAAWSLRMALSLTTPRILLHGSVYLTGAAGERRGAVAWQSGATIAAWGPLLAGTWWLLWRLTCRSQHTVGVSIPLAICMATQCTGLAVMMAGYLKGGAAAFPLTAAIVSTTLTAWWISKCKNSPSRFGTPAIVGIAIVGLFGLLFIGHFFCRLSTGHALAILMAPILCWVTELPQLGQRKPWIVGTIRLILVAIPLFIVLAAAMRDFDRDMRPLLP